MELPIHVNVFPQTLYTFSLVMIFRFHGSVLACLDAVAGEFICSHWEWKGMNTDVYFSGLCNVGPETYVLHSSVRISL